MRLPRVIVILLFEQAANYLDIKGLLDLTTTHVAHMIVEARTPEGIRKRFNIKNDLTPEDLKKVSTIVYDLTLVSYSMF